VHYQGEPLKKMRRSWATVREIGGLDDEVIPHILRHTAATWLMKSGIKLELAADYLSMTQETLETVYGHHHPKYQREASEAL